MGIPSHATKCTLDTFNLGADSLVIQSLALETVPGSAPHQLCNLEQITSPL